MKKMKEALENACQLCEPLEKLIFKLLGLALLVILAWQVIQSHG